MPSSSNKKKKKNNDRDNKKCLYVSNRHRTQCLPKIGRVFFDKQDRFEYNKNNG